MDGQLTWVAPLLQIATTGGFGALLWYFVVKYIPQIEERHRNDRSEWQSFLQRRDEEYLAVLRELRDSSQESHHVLVEIERRISDGK